MKQYAVMATTDFDHNGTERKRGQIFQMSEVDRSVWGGFVRIVSRDLLPVKKVQKPVRYQVQKTDDVVPESKRSYTRKK